MSLKILSLFGVASGKTITLYYNDEQANMNLLTFLQGKEIPIASSCKGRAACHRCKVNQEELACEYSISNFVEKFGNKVSIDYL